MVSEGLQEDAQKQTPGLHVLLPHGEACVLGSASSSLVLHRVGEPDTCGQDA
jgi:hypothetical protein